MELLPHAESYSRHSSPILRRRIAMGHWRSAPPVHAADQFSREVARVSLARALRVVRDGRSVPAGSRAIHRTEPCPCGPRLQSLRLALEQRTGALGRGRDDPFVKVAPLLAMVPDWAAFLNSAMPEEELRDIRRHSRTGRPLGDETFLGRLEETIGRALMPQKRGPKPKRDAN